MCCLHHFPYYIYYITIRRLLCLRRSIYLSKHQFFDLQEHSRRGSPQKLLRGCTIDNTFAKIYYCWDNELTHLFVECLLHNVKPVFEVFHSVGNADFDVINNYIPSNLFKPKCFMNTENASDEFFDFLSSVIQQFVTLSTKRHQSFMPLITLITSKSHEQGKNPKKIFCKEDQQTI